jgi:hypothetical protein
MFEAQSRPSHPFGEINSVRSCIPVSERVLFKNQKGSCIDPSQLVLTIEGAIDET